MVDRKWLLTVPMYLVLGVTLVVAIHAVWRPASPPPAKQPAAQLADPWPRERRAAGAGELLDLKDFSYGHVVQRCNLSKPAWVGIVHSAPHHFYHRLQIRTTWASHRQVVFLLGKADPHVQPLIDKEAREFGDIVQGSFIDAYRNMTYKHMMGLLWVRKYCPEANYILKTDDDVFVNTGYFESYLPSLPEQRLIFCQVMKASLVQRSYRSKWRVSPEEYSGRWYPSYCMGWVILYSQDVVNSLFSQAQKEPYFWIDDVHITGTVAEKLNLTHTPLGKLGLLEEEMLQGEPHSNFLFGLTAPKNFQKLWTMVNGVSSNDI